MKRTVPRAGFSLVEVSLALLVVGIGIMGVFALFPNGLETSRLTQEETRAVLFANDTFDMYRSLFDSGVSLDNLTALDPAPPDADFWNNPTSTIPRVTDTNWPGTHFATIKYEGSVTNTRYATAWRFGLTNAIYNGALRYRLVIADLGTTNSNPRVKRAHLLIWPGEFGPTSTNDAYTFYTEFYR